MTDIVRECLRYSVGQPSQIDRSHFSVDIEHQDSLVSVTLGVSVDIVGRVGFAKILAPRHRSMFGVAVE
jgi:hypothetical protein